MAFSWRYPNRDAPSRYVVARRIRYTNADVRAAVVAAFPTELMSERLHRYGGDANQSHWMQARSEWLPDPATVARLVRPERSVMDERSCPALTAALRRLNGLDVPPVRLQGYGRRDGPPRSPDEIVVVGDGTTFRLDVEVLDNTTRATRVSLKGNHDSIPGAWIEAFEAETESCWRPESGRPSSS